MNLPETFGVAALLEGVAGKHEAAPPEGLFAEPVPLLSCRFPVQGLEDLEEELDVSLFFGEGQDGTELIRVISQAEALDGVGDRPAARYRSPRADSAAGAVLTR